MIHLYRAAPLSFYWTTVMYLVYHWSKCCYAIYDCILIVIFLCFFQASESCLIYQRGSFFWFFFWSVFFFLLTLVITSSAYFHICKKLKWPLKKLDLLICFLHFNCRLQLYFLNEIVSSLIPGTMPCFSYLQHLSEYVAHPSECYYLNVRKLK